MEKINVDLPTIPNFTNAKNEFKLSFQSYKVEVLKSPDNKELFVKDYLDQRQRLYLEISEKIWSDFWKSDSLNEFHTPKDFCKHPLNPIPIF